MTLIPSQIKCEHRHLCGVSELIAEIELEQWEEDILKNIFMLMFLLLEKNPMSLLKTAILAI